MRVLVPFDATAPKSRLSGLFDADERRAFALAMLRDVLAATREAGHEPAVLATDDVEVDAPVTIDDRDLTAAVNAVLESASEPVAILVADLPLATPAAVEALLGPEAPVVLAPGLGGGTNALVVRTDAFRVDFHGASIRDHREAARAAGVEPATVDSFRLAVDVDEPGDLAEVLLHSDGRAAAWLREAGVALEIAGGRVGVRRDGPPDS